jgi:hypothetical protein
MTTVNAHGNFRQEAAVAYQEQQDAQARQDTEERERRLRDDSEHLRSLLKERLDITLDSGTGLSREVQVDGIIFVTGVTGLEDGPDLEDLDLRIKVTCARCGEVIYSNPIESMADVGAVLEGKNLPPHECPEASRA